MVSQRIVNITIVILIFGSLLGSIIYHAIKLSDKEDKTDDIINISLISFSLALLGVLVFKTRNYLFVGCGDKLVETRIEGIIKTETPSAPLVPPLVPAPVKNPTITGFGNTVSHSW